MKTTVRKFVVVCALVLSSCASLLSQRRGRADGDEVTVVKFKDLRYPALARAMRTQGAVVIQVKLDGDGSVTDAEAISGPPLLVPSAVNNIKQWQFRPNARKSAVIVYDFIFIEGRCESHGSLFVLQPSNLATVIGCAPAVEP